MIQDLTIIATLVVLEGLLSVDNALVLAVLVRHLPKPQQKKALYYGIAGAFVFRFLMLITAIWIIKLWYLRAAGAAYLLYLTVQHFRKRIKGNVAGEHKGTEGGFWKTVVVLNLVDCAFAIDSVLVAVGLSKNLIIILVGVALGIIAVRVAAGGMLILLEKWPALEDMAYLLVGWISVKLFWEAYDMVSGAEHIEMPTWLFWVGMGSVAVGGSIWAVYQGRKVAREMAQENPLE